MRTFEDLKRIIDWEIFQPDHKVDDNFIKAINEWMCSEKPFELRMDMKIQDFPRNHDGSLAEGIPDHFYMIKTLVIRERKDGKFSMFLIHPFTGKEIPVDGLEYKNKDQVHERAIESLNESVDELAKKIQDNEDNGEKE